MVWAGFPTGTCEALTRTAVILCGGRGRRLGTTGQRMPKAMARVVGYPILWYTIMQLHKSGFRHFILPLGYRGEQIQAYIDRDLNWLSARIDAVQTGEETPIGERLQMVRHLLPAGPFLLVNGDCLFDLDFDRLYGLHEDREALVTLTACKVVSHYGLIVVQDDEVVSFSRDSLVHAFSIENGPDQDLTGYVNAGITLIDRDALNQIELLDTPNFEIDLFSRLIAQRRTAHMLIDGYWYAIETQKDLEIANSGDQADPRAAGASDLRDMLLRHQVALELGVQPD